MKKVLKGLHTYENTGFDIMRFSKCRYIKKQEMLQCVEVFSHDQLEQKIKKIKNNRKKMEELCAGCS